MAGRQPPTQPFEFRGPFGGYKEGPSPKSIGPGDLISGLNIQQDFGRFRPRPGFNRARDGAFINATTIKSNNSCRYIGNHEAATPDRLYYTYGTAVARVDVDGTDDLDIYTGLTGPNGIYLDAGTTTLYVCDTTLVKSGPFVPGALSTFIDTASVPSVTISIVTSIDFNSTTSKWWLGATITGAVTPTLLRYSAVPAHELTVQMADSDGFNLTGIAIDATNANMYTATADGKIRRHSATTGAVVETLYTGLTQLRDIKLDTTNNRLYWSQGPGGGNKICYGTYVAATGAVTGMDTLISFDSSCDPFGLAIDGANDIVYACNSDGSTGSVFSVGDTVSTIVSAFPWRRSLLGSTSSVFTDDLILLQFLDTAAGGSDFQVYFPSRSSSPDDLLALTPGYTAGTSDNPDRFVMIDHDANPSASDPITPVGNYGRAAFAYTSRGFDTYKGGVLMTASSGAYVFNYFTGDTASVDEVQTVTIYGAPTGGTFVLTLDSTATAGMAFNISGANFDTALTTAIDTDDTGATVTVARTGSGTAVDPYVFTCTFTGALAGIGLPLMRCTTNSLTGGAAAQVIVERTTRGTSHNDGILYLRPAGLPRPAAPTVGRQALVGGNLLGFYEYVITFYSDVWDIESPPSTATAVDDSAGASYNDVSWTVPSTLYFNDYFDSTSVKGGPHISHVRIYRKQTGLTTIDDGNGAQNAHFFVAQVQANLGVVYRDNVSNSAQTADVAPTVNEYPPSDAQFVTVLDGAAYYSGISANNKTVWNSEKTKQGGIHDGELGYEYVSNQSFTEAFDDAASDHHITALNKFGGQLVVGTDERVLAADVSNVDEIGLAFRSIPGAAGIASHWTVTETGPLVGDEISGALLLYANPKGGMYAFNGVSAEPVARDDIKTIIKTFSPKTWQDTSLGFGAITSWYWATTVLDPDNNRIIMAAPLSAGGSIAMVYDLDTRKWLRWNVNRLAWCLSREWDSDSDLLGHPLVLCFDGSSIYKMVDGASDDGADFDWSFQTGFLDFGTMREKTIQSAMSYFDLVDFDGSAPAVTMAAYFDDNTTAVASQAITLDAATNQLHKRLVELRCDGRARHVSFGFSGTHTTSLDHPAIVGYGCEWEIGGVRLQ